MSHDPTVQAAEVAVGAAQELVRRAGYKVGHPHGMAKLGELAVKGAAALAPAAVATVVAGTTATVAAVSTAAVALAPFAVIAGAGYGAYRLVKWFRD